MLQEIHIQNYAVIEKLSLEFGLGLNLLSGETGSGKSILVDALGLALGGRASPEVIRTGCDRATVAAAFRVSSPAALRSWVERFGLEEIEGDEVLLRREIQSGGRSRLLVNDCPITVAAAKSLAPLLVEIHGQGEHVALFEPAAQLALLDRFAGTGELAAGVAGLYTARRDLAAQIAQLSSSEQERLRSLDLLNFQVQELDAAGLEPGEDARLEEEKRVLVHIEKIRAAAGAAYAALYEDEESATAKLGAAARALEELHRYDSAIEPYLAPLEDAKARIEDAALFLRDHLAKVNNQPGRLAEIEDRLALLDRLKRKYGKTVEEVATYRDRIREQIHDLQHADERRGELDRELEKAAAQYASAAEKLSAQRRSAARRLEKAAQSELAHLGMEKTRFEIQFETAGPDAGDALAGGEQGIDRIEFRISPNPGEELRPLEKTASGGELSRFMLALRTVIGTTGAERRRARLEIAPTFVFDEVDAGIGGRVAEQVGRRLKRLAAGAQVLCVTHLAQIACFADHHFFVEKFDQSGRTVTTAKLLATEKERAAELARMLSGSRITPEVLKHAASMLEQANQE
jgi:DNA repair protein RecN (Recombination protein N)